MTNDERKETARRLIDQIWNRGDLNATDDMYSATCSFHDPNFPLRGTADLKTQVRELRAANEDLHVDMHEIMCDGDLMAARFTMAGTATGEFRGIPATGRSWVMSGMVMSLWEGDRIVEEWHNFDMLGALQQMELVPDMASQD
jgi:steroid delta-isomerase-like uncharacterized protein